jgi:hypothetical protein
MIGAQVCLCAIGEVAQEVEGTTMWETVHALLDTYGSWLILGALFVVMMGRFDRHGYDDRGTARVGRGRVREQAEDAATSRCMSRPDAPATPRPDSGATP